MLAVCVDEGYLEQCLGEGARRELLGSSLACILPTEASSEGEVVEVKHVQGGKWTLNVIRR